MASEHRATVTGYRRPRHYQIIERALEILERDGVMWIQGRMAKLPDGKSCDAEHPKADGFCAFAAIKRAVLELDGDPYGPTPGRVQAKLDRFLSRDLGRPAMLVVWNDGVNRKRSDVLDVLRRAAAYERGK